MRISKKAYADIYGPTVGDKVRLADTELVVEDVDYEIFDSPAVDIANQIDLEIPEIKALVAKVRFSNREADIRLMPSLGSNSRTHLDELMNYLCDTAKRLPKREARSFWKIFFLIRDSFAYVGPASVSLKKLH